MNLITLETVSKQYSERLLLDGVDLQINDGDRIGLIGVNGSGKTTLLRILAGAESPDAGRVVRPGRVRVQYLSQQPLLDDNLSVLEQLFDSNLPQIQLLRAYEWATHQLQQNPDSAEWQSRLAALGDEMTRTDGWATEARVKAILTRLGIVNFEAPIATLSGGQQKRVALARALIDRADLLILDEPTNHIDADTIAWLEEYLADEPGALLMVTHDRYFLDRVVNKIIELDRRLLVSYPGNYSRYLELSAARREQLAQAEAKRQNLLRRELEWLRRGAQARSTKQKARKQRIEELQQISYDRGQSVSLALAGRRLGKKVLRVEQLAKHFEDRPLLQNVDFHLEPGDRVGIVGPNGSGKSSFLNILAGRLAADGGRVEWGDTVHLGYYDQQSRGLRDDMRVIDFIEQEAPLIRTTDGQRVSAFQVLEWLLFPKPQQRAYIGSLSGGERRRLYLLYVLMHRPNVLLLDEPTNDLDIQTLNVLEQFLDDFGGSLVVVSHDRYFLDRNVDYIIEFSAGRVSARYPAPYDTFVALRNAENPPPVAAAPKPEPKSVAMVKATSSARQDRPRKLTWQEQRELERLEARLEQLESEKFDTQQKINRAGADYQQMQALAQTLRTIEAELEQVSERWLELQALYEGYPP